MNLTEAQRHLYNTLGRIPSGLFVLTAAKDGFETGMLASWVQQCSFDPPLVTLAIKRGRWLSEWLAGGDAFTLNLLDDTQTDMISHFGRGFDQGQEAFEEVEIERRPSAAPILQEALGYLDCRTLNRFPAGDHEVFLCEILAGRLINDGRPMVHVRKSGTHY